MMPTLYVKRTNFLDLLIPYMENIVEADYVMRDLYPPHLS